MSDEQTNEAQLEQTNEAQLEINGKSYDLPLIESWTLGEARVAKQLTGMTLAQFARQCVEDGSDPDVLAALVWIVMHREDPTFSVDDLASISVDALLR
jgi:hypothetical protein